MLVKQLVLLIGSACFAAAAVLDKRATDPALAPLANVPAACNTTCAILQQYNAIDPNDLSTLSAVCTTQAEGQFMQCIQCFEQNSPSTFTPDLISALQSSADQLGTGCTLLGSPISSISFVAPTATGSGNASPSTGTSSSTTSSTATHSNASSRKISGVALAELVILAALGTTFLL